MFWNKLKIHFMMLMSIGLALLFYGLAAAQVGEISIRPESKGDQGDGRGVAFMNDLTPYFPWPFLDNLDQLQKGNLADSLMAIKSELEKHRNQQTLNRSSVLPLCFPTDINSAPVPLNFAQTLYPAPETLIPVLEQKEDALAVLIDTFSLSPCEPPPDGDDGSTFRAYLRVDEQYDYDLEIVYYTARTGYLKWLLKRAVTRGDSGTQASLESQIAQLANIRRERLEGKEPPEGYSCTDCDSPPRLWRARDDASTLAVTPNALLDTELIESNPDSLISPFSQVFPLTTLSRDLPSIIINCSSLAYPGWSNYIEAPGVGNEGQGAGMALINLDNNKRPEMVMMAYDNPAGNNSFRYRIGWNVKTDGKATSWSDSIEVSGVGWEGQGAGLAFFNLDSNERPDMVLMTYDSPSGANSFRYLIGWNIKTDGKATSWSNCIEVPGLGWEGQGAGLAFFNLDSNSRPEMVLMAYDNPSGANSFRYKIGLNIKPDGKATSWSDSIEVPGVGWEGQGADINLINLDTDPRPEMVLMAYDSPSGANSFRYKIGWNVKTDGKATSWSNHVEVKGLGYEGQGSGMAFYDIDSDGHKDMALMAYDNPSGANSFRYVIGWKMGRVLDFFLSLNLLGYTSYIPPTGIPTSTATQTGPNLYQLSDSFNGKKIVEEVAKEALMGYVNDCHLNPSAHQEELKDLGCKITLNRVKTDPDLMVAAIAWFVDKNMDWTPDGDNKNILNNYLHLNYNPGQDYPIPANYTIKYTGNSIFGTPARFHGDCEDHAILRAALLRSLGFNPNYIWNVIDNPISHEYNVVIYRGRFRIMDYGPITSWLSTHTSPAHRSYFAYNELYGPRNWTSTQHNHIVNNVNNYPGGALPCQGWDYHNYYEDTCP